MFVVNREAVSVAEQLHLVGQALSARLLPRPEVSESHQTALKLEDCHW